MFSGKMISWLIPAFLITSQLCNGQPLKPRAPAAGVVPALSGGQNSIAAGTYPRANFLADGSIIASYTVFANGNSIITFSRSTDRGASWSQIGTAAQGPTASTDIDNPYVLQIPSGRILVVYRNHDRLNANTYSFFRLTISYSDDNGANWSYLSDPATDPGPVNGNWEPFLRNAEDGSLQLYYSRTTNNENQDVLMRTSTDGGASWSSASTLVAGDPNNEREGMVGVATINGANLIGVFESEANGLYTVNSITSADDGATWGNRQLVYAPTGSGNNAGAPQVVNVGGTLVTGFLTDEDTSMHDWAPVPEGADCKIITSGDGGQSWGNKLTFSPVESLWPGLVTLDSGSFLALADHGGAAAQAVTLG